jgi:predicted transcriptional regulator
MSNLYFHLGGTGIPDAVMLDYTTEQAERDPEFQADTHITIRDVDMFFRILTPARVKLLRHIYQKGSVASVRALADELGRSYANVHDDVTLLLENHLLERDKTSLAVVAMEPTGELAA